MQKTLHYELKKPEITDPLRVADLNENSDLIDAAIKAAADAAQAANTTAGAAQNTAQAAASAASKAQTTANAAFSPSNLPFEVGSIAVSVENNRTDIKTFSFTPKMLFIWVPKAGTMMLNAEIESTTVYGMSDVTGSCTLALNGATLRQSYFSINGATEGTVYYMAFR